MRKQNRGMRGTSFALALFATVIVVVGVVGSAYLSSMWKNTNPVSSTETPTSTAREPMPKLLVMNESSVSLLGEDGKMRRISREQFIQQTKHLKLGEGAQAANGSVTRFGDAFRSSSGIEASLAKPKSDAASVIAFAQNGSTSTVVLRYGNAPLTQAQIHGWSDAGTLFVSAAATSSREVFDVNPNGSLRLLAALPDTLLSIEGRGGSVWYVTASPGEGIESEPMPPSELHRLRTDGTNVVVARDEKRLILNEVPGPQNDLAYYTNGSMALYRQLDASSAPVSLNAYHPLLFLSDDRLVMREGFTLYLMDPHTKNISKLADVPEGRVEMYEAPSDLDVTLFPR